VTPYPRRRSTSLRRDCARGSQRMTRQRTRPSTRANTRALTSSLAGTALLGAAWWRGADRCLASAAAASSSSDVQILQRPASIENQLAVSNYKTPLKLPYIGGSSANPVRDQSSPRCTVAQHAKHGLHRLKCRP